jgi:hypothetical protein
MARDEGNWQVQSAMHIQLVKAKSGTKTTIEMDKVNSNLISKFNF